MGINLKPCPFCGGIAKGKKMLQEYWIYCDNCKAQTGLVRSSRLALNQWNKRYLSQPPKIQKLWIVKVWDEEPAYYKKHAIVAQYDVWAMTRYEAIEEANIRIGRSDVWYTASTRRNTNHRSPL
jgi:Lar family restriction alleviation protein